MQNVLKNALPASLRKPVEASRHALSPPGRTQRLSTVPAGEVRNSIQHANRFANLPLEPEDARLTGVTRSLNRRLLGLNLHGSLVRRSGVVAA